MLPLVWRLSASHLTAMPTGQSCRDRPIPHGSTMMQGRTPVDLAIVARMSITALVWQSEVC
jgi:hypothetical protein